MRLPKAIHNKKYIVRKAAARLLLPAPIIFVIITKGRTGSTLLNSLFDSHPRIRVCGEVIGEYTLRQPDLRKEILELGALPYVKRCFNRADLESAVGIKILYYQVEHRYGQRWGVDGLPGVLNFLKSQRDIKIIHLKRRNRLKTFASGRVARLTKKYIEYQEETENARNININLTIDECERQFTRIGQWEKYYDDIFQEHKMLEVFYENLVAEQQTECNRLLDFLGVRRKPLSTRFKKQRTNPVSEVIENYEELKRHFSGTEWGRFFDE